jgi:hypothetical protein
MICYDGELLHIASSIRVSLLHLHDCSLRNCVEIGANHCTKSSMDMGLSILKQDILKQDILKLLHNMISRQDSSGWRSGGLQTYETQCSKWVEHLRTESSSRHGRYLTWNSISHSRKDNTSFISGNNLLNRNWDVPLKLGMHLWDARLPQRVVVMIEAKRDIGDACRTHIIKRYTINNILERSVGIFCVVDTIATAIEVAKDVH